MADGAASCTSAERDRQRPIPHTHVIAMESANKPTSPHLELGLIEPPNLEFSSYHVIKAKARH
jgi:hypothetical protein